MNETCLNNSIDDAIGALGYELNKALYVLEELQKGYFDFPLDSGLPQLQYEGPIMRGYERASMFADILLSSLTKMKKILPDIEGRKGAQSHERRNA